MSEQANPDLQKIEDVFKKLFWESLSLGLESALFSAAPYLNVWPLRPVISFVIKSLTDRIYGILKLAIDLAAIRFLNDEHQRAFDAAMVSLKIIAHDKGIESDAFIQARERAKESLARFVHYNTNPA